MNTELAQKLKDAGFPQTFEPYKLKLAMAGLSIDMPYFPTLSELIEAMPMRAKYLGTVNDAHFVLRKLVTSSNESRYWAYMEDEDTYEPVEGYSFRDAPADVVVANLWLALQSNK